MHYIVMSILYSKSSLSKWIPHWHILVVKFQAINFLITKLSLIKITVRLKYTQLARLKKCVSYNFKLLMNGMKLPFAVLRRFSLLFRRFREVLQVSKICGIHCIPKAVNKTHNVLSKQHLKWGTDLHMCNAAYEHVFLSLWSLNIWRSYFHNKSICDIITNN